MSKSEFSPVDLKMTIEMGQALNDLLMGQNSKGRVDTRKISHLQKALQAGCTKSKTVTRGDGTQDIQRTWNVDGGVLKIEREDALEFLIDALDDKFKAGVPGALAIGYSDLDEAVDSYKEKYKGKKE